MDNSDPARDAIHQAIQTNTPIGKHALLTGWALISEWVDDNGERWLTKAHAAQTTDWTADGMYHHALYGDWPNHG